MGAHVYQTPNNGEPEAWIARCYLCGDGLQGPLIGWHDLRRPPTDKGLALAFADRDRHNRLEHPDDL